MTCEGCAKAVRTLVGKVPGAHPTFAGVQRERAREANSL